MRQGWLTWFDMEGRKEAGKRIKEMAYHKSWSQRKSFVLHWLAISPLFLYFSTRANTPLSPVISFTFGWEWGGTLRNMCWRVKRSARVTIWIAQASACFIKGPLQKDHRLPDLPLKTDDLSSQILSTNLSGVSSCSCQPLTFTLNLTITLLPVLWQDVNRSFWRR